MKSRLVNSIAWFRFLLVELKGRRASTVAVHLARRVVELVFRLRREVRRIVEVTIRSIEFSSVRGQSIVSHHPVPGFPLKTGSRALQETLTGIRDAPN
jgi:hypothetical protein